MKSDKVNYWFEKLMAVVFLAMVVGMIMFFNFVPLEAQSENVIMVILGVLLGVAKDAIPRIFGMHDDEQDQLYQRIQQLEEQVEALTVQNQTLKVEYDKILKVLIDNYVAENPLETTNDKLP